MQPDADHAEPSFPMRRRCPMDPPPGLREFQTTPGAKPVRMWDGSRAVIRRDLCVGAGLCVLSAGTVFDQADEDGLVILRHNHLSEAEEGQVREAVHRCPSLAIRIETQDASGMTS